MNLISNLSVLWLGVMILMLVVEAAVPGLVSIWFAAGALVTIPVAALHAPFWLQVAVFLAVSVAALILTRPLAKKYIAAKVQPTNADMIIGHECYIQEEIDNVLGTGAVVAGGKVWTAVSYDDDVKLSAGTRATVESIKGVKAVVRPLDDINKEE